MRRDEHHTSVWVGRLLALTGERGCLALRAKAQCEPKRTEPNRTGQAELGELGDFNLGRIVDLVLSDAGPRVPQRENAPLIPI